MKRMISLILSITLIVVLVSCAKGEKATLKEVLKLHSATPVSELNEFDELMISIDNKRYRINNANDFVSGFCDELDRYRLEEIEIENYNIDVQDYYFSLDKESGWNSGVAFCINQDDEIQVRYNFTKSKYYKCKGVFDEITSFLASELEYQDKHYSIKSTEDYLEEYEIYDVKGNVLEKEKTSEYPHIYLQSENIICKWIQGGTGVLSRWGNFYNFKTGEKSPDYYGQIDSFGNLVSSTNSRSVTISDMFSGKELLVIDDFKEEIADHVESVISAYFNEDGTKIEIEYHTKQGEEATDIIDLPSEVLEYKGDNQ